MSHENHARSEGRVILRSLKHFNSFLLTKIKEKNRKKESYKWKRGGSSPISPLLSDDTELDSLMNEPSFQ